MWSSPAGQRWVEQLGAFLHYFVQRDDRQKLEILDGPIKTGDFDILCAELCGYAHYQMFGMLHVLPDAEFDVWQQEASRQALAAYDENDTEAHWAWDWQE